MVFLAFAYQSNLLSSLNSSFFKTASFGITSSNKLISEKELLGSLIFSDKRLSIPQGQACISCHSPDAAFSDPKLQLPVSQGAFTTKFGNRNTPTAMYLKFVPALHKEEDEGEEIYVGGLFLDGRVNSLLEQAEGPILNKLEMASTKVHVVMQVCSSTEYGNLFRKVYGSEACPVIWKEDSIARSFKNVTDAIVSFEFTDKFAPFNSKFDKVMAKTESFTEKELRGFEVFKDEKLGNCAACHSLDTDNSAQKALFTDFTYDNLGLPKNPKLKDLGHPSEDFGLENTTSRKEDRGLFRVPTLRNISKTAPYGHNGYFNTLKQIIDFYNTRDVKAICNTELTVEEAIEKNCWPSAEVMETVNHDELGNLKLTDEDIENLILFLNTLTDK